ncbi:putative photosystem II PsbY [Helianthus annuus]|nr:putative photosystem II PsbY [Helianthus annuus]KAJ0573149.1 putative photosystem II PsbY [Helianthus annuus]KAJ0740446.1 putative photosystem II PsbY [Helianthus annuus]
MAATLSTTMAMLNPNCMTTNKPSKPLPNKPISLLSLQNLPKSLTLSKPTNISLTGTAIAGAVFSTINRMRTKGVIVGLGIGGGLAASSGLFATPEATASEFAAIAEAAAANDNRGQLLLIVIAPAILWVLYNILQPALNQINKMRN